MQPNINPQTQGPSSSPVSITLILKICGALATVFLLFLPVAGCKNYTQYDVNGLDFIKGLFKAGAQIDATSILFILSMITGVIIIFFNKPLQFVIGGAAGFLTFIAAYFITKSKQGMDIVQLKIGAYLALLTFAGIAIAGLIRLLATKNKNNVQTFNPQPIYNQQQQSPIQQQYQQQPQVQQPYQQQVQTPPPPQQQAPPPPQMQQPVMKQKFCVKCGNKFPENITVKFCTKCGAKILY
jgi:ribosomal protein L40E